MIKTQFDLKNKVTITPLTGKTKVTVSSTGQFRIKDCVVNNQSEEPRYVTIAETANGKMQRSRGGLYRKLTIRLPETAAEREDFLNEIDLLYASIYNN